MTQQEAISWIKQNWNRLASEKKLGGVLKKYFETYHLKDSQPPTPVVDISRTVKTELGPIRPTPNMLDIFDGKL